MYEDHTDKIQARLKHLDILPTFKETFSLFVNCKTWSRSSWIANVTCRFSIGVLYKVKGKDVLCPRPGIRFRTVWQNSVTFCVRNFGEYSQKILIFFSSALIQVWKICCKLFIICRNPLIKFRLKCVRMYSLRTTGNYVSFNHTSQM